MLRLRERTVSVRLALMTAESLSSEGHLIATAMLFRPSIEVELEARV
jgi:hypothetical protein